MIVLLVRGNNDDIAFIVEVISSINIHIDSVIKRWYRNVFLFLQNRIAEL